MKHCNCGCQQKICKCKKKNYFALLKGYLPKMPKTQKINVIEYKYPLIMFKAKPCFVKEFGLLLEKSIKQELKK